MVEKFVTDIPLKKRKKEKVELNTKITSMRQGRIVDPEAITIIVEAEVAI